MTHTALDAQAVTRRYLLLTATRWLPTGLVIPLITIAPLERGLSLVQVGLLASISGVVVLTLELPTGGLADVIGRRPLLLFATGCNLVSTAILALGGSMTPLAIGWAIEGVYRALESGPLDAWYVDAVQAADPRADIEAGLSRRGLVLSVAIGVGCLAAGGLALLPQPDGLPVLALPLLVALALRVVDAIALAVLLREDRPPAEPAGRRLDALVRTARGTGRVVAQSTALVRASTAIAALVATEVLWGAGMTGVEIFVAPRLLELLDDAASGVGLLAVAATVGWTLSGLGSAAAPWLARRTGSWVGAAVATRVAQGAGVLLAGVLAGPVGVLSGYLGFYLFHGAANVAHQGLLNRNVGPAHRTTVLSINSLASRLGGTIAAPLLGLLAAGAGLPSVFAVCAGVLALGGPLYLLARPGAAVVALPGPALIGGPAAASEDRPLGGRCSTGDGA